MTRLWAGMVWCLLLLQLLLARFLLEVGEAAAWADVLDAWQRRRDLALVLPSLVEPGWVVGAVVTALVLGGCAWLYWRAVRKGRVDAVAADPVSRIPRTPRTSLPRAIGVRWAVGPVLAVVAGLGLMIWQPPTSRAEQELARNGLWLLARTATLGPPPGESTGWPRRWVDESSLAQLAAKQDRPNVLLVVLESTGLRQTSLPTRAEASALEPDSSATPATPRLLSLSREGVTASQARAVLPHTSKSLFSILCGHYPAMQIEQWEATQYGDVDCFADVLRRAGYDTAFAQSAFGVFEQRPRLVRNVGFEQFAAWEQLRGEQLGYLASDDLSLVGWFEQWLRARDDDETSEKPFFVTVLTAAAHHDYELPRDLRAGAADLSDAERHALLVTRQDEMLGGLIDLLQARALLEESLLLVVGDHGEGFGSYGVSQHDNNYYDEALLVPFVLRGPGVPRGVVVEHPASLVDVLPTLAAALGLQVTDGAELPGSSLLARLVRTAPEAMTYFGCLHFERCSGFVWADVKWVNRSRDRLSFGFDLRLDPLERLALPLSMLESRRGESLGAGVRLHEAWARSSRFAPHEVPRYTEEVLYGYHCDSAGVCRHPKARRSTDRTASESSP